jgi:pimeloyl-ACP methyl ester carboxylesterase
MESLRTRKLKIAYDSYGQSRSDTTPLILLHGFPDDASAWQGVADRLASAGHRAIAPYVRGCGPTQFLHAATPRDGTVGARLGDLIEFMDGLRIEKAVLIGQDWGAATAQAAAMLTPERVSRLVILNGHALYNMAVAGQGVRPSYETLHAGWYQWLFQTPLGEPLLRASPRDFACYLWKTWSPGWDFSPEEFETAARSFQNPDWVATVISGYRGGAPNIDPDDAQRQQATMRFPQIRVPTLNLQGANDGVDLFADTQLGQEKFYVGGLDTRVLPNCGHFLHREHPDAVAQAIRAFLATP